VERNRNRYRVLRTVLVGWLCVAGVAAAEEPDHPLRRYYVAFLYKGPRYTARPAGGAERQEQHKKHLAFIDAMTSAGKLVTYGPFADAGDLRGMYVFRAGSIEEAQKLADQEPSVKTGYVVMRVFAWYGPARPDARAPAIE
jgi:uncharacterized protein